MNTIIAKLITVGLLLCISNANAYTSYGAKGCGKLISAIDTNDKKDEYNKDLTRMITQSWIAGYLTAYNSWQEAVTNKKDTNVIATTDIDGVWQSVLIYCRANPLQNVIDAMDDTIGKLDTTQTKRKK